MKTLFISTYNEEIIIGLLSDGILLTEKRKKSLKSHSVYLIPLIKEIIEENNITIQDLNEILVINGPGSFTGIRLGITVAKTLAYTLHIPIKTITSLEAIAVSNKEENKLVTISDTKGKYIGLFKGDKLLEPISYLSEDDFNIYLKNKDTNIIDNNFININAAYNYSKNINSINPHEVKAVYIKEIEALNGR